MEKKNKKEHVYNRFFNEDKWALVNPLNKEIMEDYMLELKQRQIKPSTIKQYKNDWRIVFILINDMFKNKSILELTKKDFRKLSLFLKESKDMSNARVNRLMSAIRSMLNYAEDDDDWEYENNVANKVKGLKREGVRDIIFLTDEEVFILKDLLMERKEYQKLTALFLAYDSGGRKNELFQVEKFNFYDESKHSTNEVIGKRGKVFPLVYFSETKKAAGLYLEQRGKDDIDSMWTTGFGGTTRGIEVGAIYDWFKYMNKLLEVHMDKEYGFSPHSFRHSTIENMMEGVATHYMLKEVGRPNGFTLAEVMLHVNHSDVSTTLSYTRDKTGEQKLSMFGFKVEE